MSIEVVSQFMMQFVDSANDILGRFLYIFMLLLMSLSLFIGNFFIDN